MATVKLEHNCPHCGKRVELAIAVMQEEVSAADRCQSWLNQQHESTRAIIEEVRSNGLLAAFENAVKQVRPQLPRNMPKHFLGFMKAAAKRKLSAAQKLVLLQEFKEDGFEVLEHLGIAALIQNGELRMFVPMDHIAPQSLALEGKVNVADLSKAQTSLRDWRRTKMGYVPAEASEFFFAMRKRSVGEFANSGL